MEKIVYLFINDETDMPMDVGVNTLYEQVGPTRFSRDEDTGQLEIIIRVRMIHP